MTLKRSYSSRFNTGRDADNADETWRKLVLPLEASLLQAGLSDMEIQSTLKYLRDTLYCSGTFGLRNVSIAIKRWQKVTRNILSDEDPARDDDSSILGSRLARRCAHLMRKLGLTDVEITLVVKHQGRRRIPPFFFSSSLIRCLFENPGFEDLKLAVSPASMGRTAPQGDQDVVSASLSGFVKNVENVPKWSFDYSIITSNVLRALHLRVPVVSHWEAPGTASRVYTREDGGKRAEVKNEVFLEFMHQPLSLIVPEPPVSELYDTLGNIILYPNNWSEFAPIGTVIYCASGMPQPLQVDERFGRIGFLWAQLEIRKISSLTFTVDEDLPCMGDGRIPEILDITGSLPSRVTAQPEEGWKVRIITISDFCVSLLGSMGRHLLDPALIDLDPLLKIGLRSAVKLYDSLAYLNGESRGGLATAEMNNIHFPWAVSADLTTATDTPYRRCISTILEGWMGAVPHAHPCRRFLSMIIKLSSVDRDFEMPKGFKKPVHRSGIMMGEGLSGIFLNTYSLLVRMVVPELRRQFPEIIHFSEEEIKMWLTENQEIFQVFLNNFKSSDGLSSNQSGDDLFRFDSEQCSPWMRMFYLSGGFIPSGTTWFESRRYVTFCEEHAIRTRDSNGWTFVDTLKPRYFNTQSDAGPIAICSRIRQITNTLKYRGDPAFTKLIIPMVDKMVRLSPELSSTLGRYSIPAGLPSWLGGIDHPEGLIDDFVIPTEYRQLINYLYIADIDVLLKEYVMGIVESTAPTTESSQIADMLTDCFLMLEETQNVESMDHTMYINRENLQLPVREPGEKYGYYKQRANLFIKSLDLTTVEEILSSMVASDSIRESIEGEFQPLVVPMRKRLRNRRNKLLSLVPEDFSIFESSDATLWDVHKRINLTLGRRLVKKEIFLDHFGLTNNPSFLVHGCRRY